MERLRSERGELAIESLFATIYLLFFLITMVGLTGVMVELTLADEASGALLRRVESYGGPTQAAVDAARAWAPGADVSGVTASYGQESAVTVRTAYGDWLLGDAATPQGQWLITRWLSAAREYTLELVSEWVP